MSIAGNRRDLQSRIGRSSVVQTSSGGFVFCALKELPVSLFLHDACGGDAGRAGYALDIGRVCSFRDLWSTAQVRGAAGEDWILAGAISAIHVRRKHSSARTLRTLRLDSRCPRSMGCDVAPCCTFAIANPSRTPCEIARRVIVNLSGAACAVPRHGRY